MVFVCPPTYINRWWKSKNQPTNHRSGGDIGHRFFRVSSGFTTGTQLVNIALQHLPVGRDFSLQDMGVGLWASDEVTDACLKRFFYKKKPSLEQTGSLSLDQMDQRQPKHWWQLKWAATCVVYLLMSSFSFSWPHFSAYSRHVQTKGTSMFSRRFLFLFLFLIDPPIINWSEQTNQQGQGKEIQPTPQSKLVVWYGKVIALTERLYQNSGSWQFVEFAHIREGNRHGKYGQSRTPIL